MTVADSSDATRWTGPVRAAWRVGKLRHVARIFAGGTPDKTEPRFWEEGTVPWLNSGAVNDWLISEPTTYISDDGFRRSSAKWIPAGSLVLALAGQGKTKGTVARIAASMTCNQSMAAIVPSGWVDNRFLQWWLHANYAAIRSLAGGDLRDGLNLDLVGGIPVPLPQLDFQRAIADFLDTETARIEALITKKGRQVLLGHERIAAVLETAAWKPGEKEMRLNRLVRRFVDYRGATPEKSDVGIPLVTAGHIKNGRVDLVVDPQFVSEETYRTWMSRGYPSIGDVLMTMEAPLGEVAQVEQLPIALAQRVILMKADEQFVTADFLALLLRTPSFQARLAAAATGSTALGIRADRLRSLSLPVPPVDEQLAAVGRVRRAAEQLRQLEKRLNVQRRLLHEHRQALITAAVTGELDVPGVAP